MADNFEEFKKECTYLANLKKGEFCGHTGLSCSYDCCRLNPPTPSSFGKKKSTYKNNYSLGSEPMEGGKKTIITPLQLEAFKLRNSGMKFKDVADKMNLSITQAHKHYKNFLRKTKVPIEGGKNNGVGVKKTNGRGVKKSKIKIRLHNDEIKIQIKNDLDKLPGKIIPWHEHCSYKLFKTKDMELRYFNHSTLIKFKKDIIADTAEEAEIKANERLKFFLVQTYGLNQYIQLKRHYGILGTQVAKYVRDKDIDVIIYDDVDPVVRARFDFSHRVPEIDCESPKYGRTDTEKVIAYYDPILKKPHYTPDEAKIRIDAMYGVLKAYTEQLELHLEVERGTRDNLAQMNEVQTETLKTLKAIQKNLSKK
ncbi:MAG: hypothetical protein ACFFDN_01305 [Candidatus Hodarchaeota archaeon]